MSRIFQALTAEPWAIVPSELQKIAAIVQRSRHGFLTDRMIIE